MAFFTAAGFKEKLNRLVNTPESIQTLSQNVLFHKKHGPEICDLCAKFIQDDTTNDDKKLVLFYLVNDIVQVGKRKAPNLVEEFMKVLPSCMPSLSKTNPVVKQKVERTLFIWRERHVFDAPFMNKLDQAFRFQVPAPRVRSPVPEAVPPPTKETELSAHRTAEISTTNAENGGVPSPFRKQIAQLVENMEQVVTLMATTDNMGVLSAKLPQQYDFESKLGDDVEPMPAKEHMAGVSQLTSSLTILEDEKVALESELEQRKKVLGMLRAITDDYESRISKISENIAANVLHSDRLNSLVDGLKKHAVSPSSDTKPLSKRQRIDPEESVTTEHQTDVAASNPIAVEGSRDLASIMQALSKSMATYRSLQQEQKPNTNQDDHQ